MNFKVNESAAKLRGGYYTDFEISRFISKWVLEINPQRVLEPSCGDGVFFQAIKSEKQKSLTFILGFETESLEAKKAKQSANSIPDVSNEIRNRDFLSWALSKFSSNEKFDGVLGNPPYIRYQYLDKNLQNISEAIFKYHHLPFTKHTNAWVPFVISSIALLRGGGRLGMVLPSELLHVLHAQSLRNYLAKSCEKILIIDPNEIWFENTLQGVVIVLAEKKSSPEFKSRGLSIVQTSSRDFLKQNPAQLFKKAESLNGETIEGKWLKAFLSLREREILASLRLNKDIFQFSAIADVDVGIVTGANKFFLVTDEIVKKYGLARWSHPMYGRSDHVDGVIYTKSSHNINRKKGYPTNFIWLPNESIKKFPQKVKTYIESGEKEGLHTRYKCRIRNPWYSVPSVYASPVGMLKRSHDFPRLILNQANAYTTDTAYRIKSKIFSAEQLVYSFINSITMLTAELEGRHYGGGVLELVPSEIEKMLIPIIPVRKSDLLTLDEMIKSGMNPEDVLHVQDEKILKRIGLSRNEIDTIFTAWRRLRFRRQRVIDVESEKTINSLIDLD